jgi:hypothetical protein
MNKVFNGVRSTIIGLSSVAALVISFSGILPPKIVIWAQLVSGAIVALHVWFSQYKSELKDVGITIDPLATANIPTNGVAK